MSDKATVYARYPGAIIVETEDGFEVVDWDCGGMVLGEARTREEAWHEAALNTKAEGKGV